MSDWQRPSAYAYKGDRRAKAARTRAARASRKKGGRRYEKRKRPGELVDPRGKTISTQSTTPVVVAVDVTGSMQHWPAEIFDRLPLLYQTLSQYRPDLELAFLAIGDATCDRFPLQVTDFAKGVSLEDQLQGLYGEGGGGGQVRESYELFAYYMLQHCRAPNATRPYLIVYGDESFYDRVDPGQVRHFVGDELQEPLDSMHVWRALCESWNVFHLRKSYGGHDASIEAQWAEALGGKERIVRLDDEQRAVDLALGLIARGWGHYGDFEENMRARQSDAKVRALGSRLDDVARMR